MRASPVPTFQMMIALSQPKSRKKNPLKITALVYIEEKRKEKQEVLVEMEVCGHCYSRSFVQELLGLGSTAGYRARDAKGKEAMFLHLGV